ncbi:hypothetical protein Pelo_13293 [Pelomyxa schiedti]|nr:hypothetical protein Pelo_13293 [Pelomyxa schiedti]
MCIWNSLVLRMHPKFDLENHTYPFYGKCAQLVELLLQYRADTNIKNDDGKTPVDLAKIDALRQLFRQMNILPTSSNSSQMQQPSVSALKILSLLMTEFGPYITASKGALPSNAAVIPPCDAEGELASLVQSIKFGIDQERERKLRELECTLTKKIMQEQEVSRQATEEKIRATEDLWKSRKESEELEQKNSKNFTKNTKQR